MGKYIKTHSYSGPERRNGNGTKTLMFWLMGAMLSMCLVGGSAWASFLGNQLSSITKELGIRQKRISANEKSVAIIMTRMDRIESKIDRLIERL